MKPILLFITILILPAFDLLAVELPDMLKMRIDQMITLQPEKVKLTKEWPKNASGLFQGLNKEVKTEMKSKKDYLAAVASIPRHLMKNRIIGDTIETNGWFYTSIEHKDWDTKKATWFSVIASKKGSKILRFSYTW
tara:strand:- start:5114 stop:5521 length:408 start_codon:yes stop_codon:yes gene_type:complete